MENRRHRNWKTQIKSLKMVGKRRILKNA